MSATIVERTESSVTIQIQVSLSRSMLATEETIRA